MKVCNGMYCVLSEPAQAAQGTGDFQDVIIDVEFESDDIGHHDSQMVSQEISDVEDDADVHVEGMCYSYHCF